MLSRPTTTRHDNTPDHNQARSRLIPLSGSELTDDHLFASPRDTGMPNPERDPLVIAPPRRLLDDRGPTVGAGSLGRCTAPAT